MAYKMSIKQWKAYEQAKKAGNSERCERIISMGFNPEFDIDDIIAEEAVIIEAEEIEDETQSILDDVAGGLENKEICERYGISPQKLVAIKKKAK